MNAHPAQRSFVYEGHRLVYDDHGPASDRPLVLIPGLILPRRMQDPLARRLAERGNRVLNLDPLAHGESDRPAEVGLYSMAAFAEQAIALLDHLGIDEAVIGGTSLGANVSLEAAALTPERVRGLVLEMPVLERAVIACVLAFSPMVFAQRLGVWPGRLLGGVLGRLPESPSALGDTLIRWLGQDPAPSAAALEGIYFGRWAPPPKVRRGIEAPALVIAHTMDPIHQMGDSEQLVEELGDARMVRARTALEMRVSPGRLVGEIASFLDECWAGGEVEGEAGERVSERDWAGVRASGRRRPA